MFATRRISRLALAIVVLAAILSAATGAAYAGLRHDRDESDWDWRWGKGIGRGDLEIDLENDGSISISHDDHDDDLIQITDDYELFINDDEVSVDRKQRKLLRNYHTKARILCLAADEIGKEGARIGMQGAKLGAVALVRLVKMLGSDYDSDDFEADMEEDAEDIEELAEELEERAEELEDLADDMDDIAEQLCDEVPELAALRWF